MKQKIILWLGAALITFLAGYYNSVTDKNFPVTGTIGIGGEKVSYKFDKVHKENSDYTILIRSDADSINGKIYWHKGNEPWQIIQLKREGKNLIGEIPLQKPLTEIEYNVVLNRNEKNYRLPGPINLEFFGKVNPMISFLYYFTLFGGLLLAARTGFESFSLDLKIKTYTIFTTIFFFSYTIAVNPLKRTYEVGAINSFVPTISVLFDLQAVLLLSCWLLGGILIFSFKNNKNIAPIFSILTILIFIIL